MNTSTDKPSPTILNQQLLQGLYKIYASCDILIGEEYQHMAEDNSHAVTGHASCILTPRTHQQIEDTVHWARLHKIALVPSGGRTGLSGGACAHHGEVVLSMSKMNNILEFDQPGGLITVEAGTPIETIQNYALNHGWFYPVDYASKSTAQIGGAVATNAGGLRVLRYGMTRDWIAGIKAVLGTGKTLNINRYLVKDNAGYDLKNLLVGSEGTLAIITEVTLRLTQPMPPQQTIFIGVDNLAELVNVFTTLRKEVSLSAAEFFCNNALKSVTYTHGLANPLMTEYNYYLLVEYDYGLLALKTLSSLLAEYDVIVSHSKKQTKVLWQLRELISSTINPQKPYKNDISCRLSLLEKWLNDLNKEFTAIANDIQLIWFGHLGDGNIHLNIIKPQHMTSQTFSTIVPEFDKLISQITQQYHASASGEHGIGILKKQLLSSSRSPEEIDIYRQLKAVFDPDGILNPGKLIETD